MEAFVAWAGFVGAWLLVAGSIYQATLELRSESIEQERIEALKSEVERPPKVSKWWWLLPPVHYVLQRRRSRLHRQRVVSAMSDSEFAVFSAFVDKAYGWLFVAAGSLFIAAKETYELKHHYEWHLATFWVLTVVMVAACIGNTVMRSKSSQRHSRSVIGEKP